MQRKRRLSSGPLLVLLGDQGRQAHRQPGVRVRARVLLQMFLYLICCSLLLLYGRKLEGYVYGRMCTALCVVGSWQRAAAISRVLNRGARASDQHPAYHTIMHCWCDHRIPLIGVGSKACLCGLPLSWLHTWYGMPPSLTSLHAPSIFGRPRHQHGCATSMGKHRCRPAYMRYTAQCTPLLPASLVSKTAAASPACSVPWPDPNAPCMLRYQDWRGTATVHASAGSNPRGRMHAPCSRAGTSIQETNRVGVGVGTTLAMLPPYVLHKHTPVCAPASSERLPLYRPTAWSRF